MKLLIVTPYFYPAVEFGGPVTVTYNLAKWFTKNGAEVKVLTTDAQSPKSNRNLPSYSELGGFETHRLKNLNNYLAYNLRLFLPTNTGKKIDDLISWADVIHFHDLFTPLHLQSRYYLKKHKKPYVITPHGTLDPVRLKQQPISKQIFLSIGIRQMLQQADAIHALNKIEEKEIKQALNSNSSKVQVIPNAVDKIHTSKTKAQNFRKQLGISRDNTVLSYLGRIDQQKGLDDLVDIFADIVRQKPNTYLVLAGPDFNMISKLKNQAEKFDIKHKILFTGTLNQEGKEELFSTTDIFVYPSPSEGFSVAILESLAAGVPVVITKECKFDQVEAAKAGYVTSSKTQFRKSVTNLLEDKRLRKVMSKNASKLSSQFTWKEIGPQYKRLYSELA